MDPTAERTVVMTAGPWLATRPLVKDVQGGRAARERPSCPSHGGYVAQRNPVTPAGRFVWDRSVAWTEARAKQVLLGRHAGDLSSRLVVL